MTADRVPPPDRSPALSASTIRLSACRSTEARSAAEIAKQLAKLEGMAKERGIAIGVVRPNPRRPSRLRNGPAKLEGKGIVLVPVSAAVQSQRQS